MNFFHTMIALAALVTGMMAGNEFAVIVFFHPALYGLPGETHARAAKAFAGRLGAVMPFWYAATLLLLSLAAWQLRRVNEFAFSAVCAAAILMAAVVIFTIFYMVSINNRISNLNVETLPEGWKTDRMAWDAAHRGRAAALALIFALLLIGLVALMPKA